MVNKLTILDELDLKLMGQYSEKSLSLNYIDNLQHLKDAEPNRKNKINHLDLQQKISKIFEDE